MQEHDVAIVGAGPAGLALGLALARAGLAVALADAQPEAALAEPAEDGREIALTHPSIALLQRLGIWQHLRAGEIGRIRSARVVDGPYPQAALQFAAPPRGPAALGAIVANQALRRASHAQARATPGITLLGGMRATAVRTLARHAELELAADHAPLRLRSRLLVAADSRFSPTRRQLGVGAAMQDFGRSMVVCRMRHALAHGETAHECFGYARTLAVLPLVGDVSSVVLTTDAADAGALMALPEADFAALVQAQFGARLGAMELATPRHLYPLVGVYAERFAGHRFALAGDAAVGMHPVTAHGYNLGLQGVLSLAAVLQRAHAAGQDIGHATVLRPYARQHRAETTLLYHGTNAVARLYASSAPAQRLLRQAVLRGAERLAPLKWAITRQLTGGAPTTGW
ncbi:5-demethoxyubiquinol-8 5-hydroxylase UbiM [Pseudorhodoferax sp.]|uniref:5-demethoxyubiquinol-8 5-hydroxylase UbiM n=1 Tax=Pseudorhodoferax sp. TaxID=1993553 RepID=UPI002DD6AF8C|nr:5-demethoxyubiquinol-8 5-hydroxylase UbiM [Pseudorhodoferax sp.]